LGFCEACLCEPRHGYARTHTNIHTHLGLVGHDGDEEAAGGGVEGGSGADEDDDADALAAHIVLEQVADGSVLQISRQGESGTGSLCLCGGSDLTVRLPARMSLSVVHLHRPAPLTSLMSDTDMFMRDSRITKPWATRP
jgi:hypothetical protein